MEIDKPRWNAANSLALCRAVNQVIVREKSCAEAMRDLYEFGLFLDWFGRGFKRYEKEEPKPEQRLKTAFHVAVNLALGPNQPTETACRFLSSELSRLSNNGRPNERFIKFVSEMIEMLEGSVEQKLHAEG